jgi:hypothetical protein
MPSNYRLWVNTERTIKVELWPPDHDVPDGPEVLTVATREHEGQIWGPPVECVEEGRRDG